MHPPHTPKDQNSASFSSMHVSCNEGTSYKSTLGQKWQDFLGQKNGFLMAAINKQSTRGEAMEYGLLS